MARATSSMPASDRRNLINRLKNEGASVATVGDNINHAPDLAAADVGSLYLGGGFAWIHNLLSHRWGSSRNT